MRAEGCMDGLDGLHAVPVYLIRTIAPTRQLRASRCPHGHHREMHIDGQPKITPYHRDWPVCPARPRGFGGRETRRIVVM